MPNIRNIAIIAHVDHGKTTLIDKLFSQTGTFRENQNIDERIMDNNEIEKERGITILAKCTSVLWKNIKINIIDTPGHSDFGGEVERVLSITDGVVLLVDAAEGPMPQTKFVLDKALQQKLKPIVVINKIDKQDQRVNMVTNEILDLFCDLNATDEQLDFPVLYSSGRNGWCIKEISDERKNLEPLLDLIIEHVPEPQVDENGSMAMLVTMLDSDPFLGRMLTGKVFQGTVRTNTNIHSINLQGEKVETAKLTKLQTFKGVDRITVDTAVAGDIISVAGLSKTSVSDTVCDIAHNQPLESTPIDPPTMSVSISVNDSPFAGQDGDKVTSRVIRDRLMAEAETNVAITVTESEDKDSYEVGGRGELQLGVLIETMRREGFELSVSRPKVLMRHENDAVLEPIEEVMIDIDDQYRGIVIDKMTKRKADLVKMTNSNSTSRVRITFDAPSRGLIGYQGEFLTDTRGTGIMNRIYKKHDIFKGEIQNIRNGSLIATAQGEAVAYALNKVQERGKLFIKPQEKVYQGMIVGEHNRGGDLEVNVLKGKQLTNIRASGSDEAIRLTPPVLMSLEEMIAYIQDDELLEVTPNSIRLRKRFLDTNDRKKSKRG